MVQLAGEVLILTGPPGSGKTTAAEALAQQPGSRKVHLRADDFWHCIRHGGLPPYMPEARPQNRIVVSVIAKVAEEYALGGYFVVLDGVIGPWSLWAFEDFAVPLHYIVLRPPIDATLSRCGNRAGQPCVPREVLREYYGRFCGLGVLERHVLPLDAHSREEVLTSVISAAQSGEFRIEIG